MAEIQRVASPSFPPASPRTAGRPRLPHPPRYNAPLRMPLEETQSLGPPALEPTAPSQVPVLPRWREDDDQTLRVEEPYAGGKRLAAAPRLPPRTRGEWLLMTILLLGLALNGAVLLVQPGLTRADVALGTTVLIAGIVLLVLMELCRSQTRR